jgi:uncharacterized protein YrrD
MPTANRNETQKPKTIMLSKAEALKGYKLLSRDGEIGKINEFYFNDQRWNIRYLVANTGNWLTSRQVLISPSALGAVNKEAQNLAIDLTKKQIEDSPSVDSDRPVSRQSDEPLPDEKSLDPHLRSTENVTGHQIQAADGEVGHVQDFIIDDETWTIRYLLIDTGNWWPGTKVLVSPQWIDHVSWGEKKVFVKLSREAIKRLPEYSEKSLRIICRRVGGEKKQEQQRK